MISRSKRNKLVAAIIISLGLSIIATSAIAAKSDKPDKKDKGMSKSFGADIAEFGGMECSPHRGGMFFSFPKEFIFAFDQGCCEMRSSGSIEKQCYYFKENKLVGQRTTYSDKYAKHVPPDGFFGEIMSSHGSYVEKFATIKPYTGYCREEPITGDAGISYYTWKVDGVETILELVLPYNRCVAEKYTVLEVLESVLKNSE